MRPRARSGMRVGVRAEGLVLPRELARAVALEEDRLAVGREADDVGAAVEVEIAPRRGAQRGGVGGARAEARGEVRRPGRPAC